MSRRGGGTRRSGVGKSDEVEQRPQGFTVERAAEVIDDLPPDVPHESAVRIVRGTLTAAGIKVEDLERSTRVRESKLNSEMDLARDRQEEIRRGTEEVVRSLEEEIRKAREDRDAGIAQEDNRLYRAAAGIEGLKRSDFSPPRAGKKRRRLPRGGRFTVDETRVIEPSTRKKLRLCAARPVGGADSLATTPLTRKPSPGATDGPTTNVSIPRRWGASPGRRQNKTTMPQSDRPRRPEAREILKGPESPGAAPRGVALRHRRTRLRKETGSAGGPGTLVGGAVERSSPRYMRDSTPHVLAL